MHPEAHKWGEWSHNRGLMRGMLARAVAGRHMLRLLHALEQVGSAAAAGPPGHWAGGRGAWAFSRLAPAGWSGALSCSSLHGTVPSPPAGCIPAVAGGRLGVYSADAGRNTFHGSTAAWLAEGAGLARACRARHPAWMRRWQSSGPCTPHTWGLKRLCEPWRCATALGRRGRRPHKRSGAGRAAEGSAPGARMHGAHCLGGGAICAAAVAVAHLPLGLFHSPRVGYIQAAPKSISPHPTPYLRARCPRCTMWVVPWPPRWWPTWGPARLQTAAARCWCSRERG